jgi:hypothetical protein
MFNYLHNTSHHGTCSSTFSVTEPSVQSSTPKKPFSVQLLNQFSHSTSAHVQHNALQNLKHELNLAVNRIVHHGVSSEIGTEAQHEIAQVILGLADKLASGDVHFKKTGAAVRLILRILNPDQIEKNWVKGVSHKTFHGLTNITQNPAVKPHLYTTATWLELTGKLMNVFPSLSEKKMNDVGGAIFSTLCVREKELANRDLARILTFVYGTFLKYTVSRNVYLGQTVSSIEQSKTRLTNMVSPEHLIAKQAYFINKLDKNSPEYYRVRKALQWAQYDSSLFNLTSVGSYSGENVPSAASIDAYNNRIQNMRIAIVQKTGEDVYDDWLDRLAEKCESRPLDVIWANSVHTLYAAALAARERQSVINSQN